MTNRMILRTLSLPFKVLATFFLLAMGISYLFALTSLYLIDVEPHTKHGMGLGPSVIRKYYGGSRGEYVTDTQKKQLVQWIRQGAGEAEFVKVQPILKQACGECHSASGGMPTPSLMSYAEVAPYTAVDMGESIKALVRVSHIHLFGMSFIFMLTSLIFAFSETSVMFRAVLIAIPFLAIWLDIGSWWFTKYQPVFAYAVIGGGILMGVSFALQVGISLYEMWFRREGTPSSGHDARNEGR